MAQQDRKGRTVAGIIGAGAGATFTATSMALSGGCPADAPQDAGREETPPGRVIRQEVEDRKQLLTLLDKIAAYKRYNERDYTEVWEMHQNAAANGDRQHRGFVDAAQKVGVLVGKAQDAVRKIRKTPDDVSDVLRDFHTAARDVMDLHVSGRDPLKLAMSEVPVKYWPEDRLEKATARYDAFLGDVKLAAELVRKLGLDREAGAGAPQPHR